MTSRHYWKEIKIKKKVVGEKDPSVNIIIPRSLTQSLFYPVDLVEKVIINDVNNI